MKKLLLFLLLISSVCQGQMMIGISASSKNYSGGTEKTYTDIPSVPAFSDTHTLVQVTTGNAIQTADINGKTDFLVSSTGYTFMQFNGLSGTYRMKSQVDTDPSTWSSIGSASPQDYAFTTAAADPAYSVYNLKFVLADNTIKLPGANPTLNYTYQNIIVQGGAFGGMLINENVAGQDYGNFTFTNVMALDADGENWYLGKTGGNSLAYFRGITTLTDCYSENSGREALQFNGHQDVRVERFLAVNGGLDTGAGIGQNNCFQLQDVYTGYFKKAIFWNFPAPGMVASDDFLFEDCFFYFTNATRTMFLQSMVANDYTEMVHTGGTLTFRRCTFYNPNFTSDYMFTMQGSTRNYVFENCIFPESVNDAAGDNTVDEICDDQRADKITYSVTITGTTFDDTPNLPSFCNPPEAAYIGFQKVVCDDYYYNLGYGPRTPAP